MKTSVVYFFVIIFFTTGCASKVRVHTDKKHDEEKRMTYKHVTVREMHDDGHESTYTDTYNYFYNTDGTLDYTVHCPRNQDFGCSESFSGYVSQYYYRFDTLLQQAEIISMLYEKCFDYPLKYRKVYNTKGTCLKGGIGKCRAGMWIRLVLMMK